MPSQNDDYRVVLFGAGGMSGVPPTPLLSVHITGVGKTSLVSRFINGTFRESYTATTEDTYK